MSLDRLWKTLSIDTTHYLIPKWFFRHNKRTLPWALRRWNAFTHYQVVLRIIQQEMWDVDKWAHLSSDLTRMFLTFMRTGWKSWHRHWVHLKWSGKKISHRGIEGWSWPGWKDNFFTNIFREKGKVQIE